MRYTEIIHEDYRVVTRDSRGNSLSGTKLLDDVDIEKVIIKWPTDHRYHEEILAVFEISDDYTTPSGLYIILAGGQFRYGNASYEGEIIPIFKFILSRWPNYAEFTDHETGETFQEMALRERPRVADVKDWYHGTSSIKVPDILRLGMIPQTIEQRLYRGIHASLDGVVYMTADESTARMHAENSVKMFGGAPTVLKINIEGLEDRIVTDQDVRATRLGKPGDNVDIKRVQRRPGEASYLTIGTIALKGRITPNRISIFWQGKETKKAPRVVRGSDNMKFLNELGKLADGLSKNGKSDFFKVIALTPAGWSSGKLMYSADSYQDVTRTLYSVYNHSKTQPAQFARWLRGMKIRCGPWERKNTYGSELAKVKEIVALIKSMS